MEHFCHSVTSPSPGQPWSHRPFPWRPGPEGGIGSPKGQGDRRAETDHPKLSLRKTSGGGRGRGGQLGGGSGTPRGQAKGHVALVGAGWVGARLSHLRPLQPWPHWPRLQAKSQFKRRSTANNVEIHIPVPNDADSPKFKTTVGSVKWVPENSEIVWSIKSFPVSTLLGGAPPPDRHGQRPARLSLAGAGVGLGPRVAGNSTFLLCGNQPVFRVTAGVPLSLLLSPTDTPV